MADEEKEKGDNAGQAAGVNAQERVVRSASGVVLNKHKEEPAAPKEEATAPPQRKKLVIKRIRRDADHQAATQGSSGASSQGGQAEHGSQLPARQKRIKVITRKPQPATQAPSASAAAERGKGHVPFDFNTARPNIRAGNLSGERPRYRRGEGTSDGRGFERGSSFRPQERGGFTGSKARESFQRQGTQRSGDGTQRSYGPRGGQGFNRAGQGGFNRASSATGRPGGASRYAPRTGGFAPPVPPGPGRAPARRPSRGKKQFYEQRKDREQMFDEEELYQKKKRESALAAVPPEIEIMETVTVSDLARKMNLKASEIISRLMSMGMMVTINQTIDSDTATILASEYNCQVKIISLYDETVIASDAGTAEEHPRPPIVTVMGHVDHGKTKTLDAIRNSHVAEGEAGGITQKIGAYQVTTPKGVITFLDTPGHEAFTMMRARGAQVTDIVVLVVAADDGVMPQTIEAINHARDAKVPIIVAVNKIDKPDANPERVMTQLSELGLTPEAWGGDTQFVNISALRRQGIDELLDAILVQAEVLDLKAQYDCRAEGKVIESRTDQGRGVVATVLVQRGTLKVGDPLVAGVYAGRVRAMFNDKGEKVTEATPAMPVEVLGLEAMPNAGDPIQVVESEREARAYALKRQELKRLEEARAVKHVTLDNLYSAIEASEVREFKVIIKADLQGSAEALKQSLEKLSTKELRVNVIHSSAGAINESDVTLAAADENAIIIGFNVRPTPKARALAEQENVEIRKYNVIYKCVEEIQQAMEGMLRPDTKEETVGNAEVRETFRVPKVGVIAGCYVTDGTVKRTSSVNVIRDGLVVYTGNIASLRRFKDDVKEVKAGFECGIGIENYQDIRVGDTLEVFDTVEVRRTLAEAAAAGAEADSAGGSAAGAAASGTADAAS